MRADDDVDRALEERLDDAVRARREAEVLVKIADIEKAAVLAQLAAVRAENNRLENLVLPEVQAHEETRKDLAEAKAEKEAIRHFASVAATQIGRAFTAAGFEGIWPLRRWLLRQRARKLRQSGLVDPAWYLARYPDVAEAGMDPVLHYLHYGAGEGRAPNPALQEPPET